ncbi:MULTISPECIES: YdeI/OmpD-associated family protein [Lactococcus]|jgi:hypothetical protein|uniref:DUF1905 domain-containing protein n=1 Tax=Lactococcus lactis subsp. lactis TaxID=1360 RepID=A0A2Z3KHL5_LACLL|nr:MULTISPECIES: YdeI/OmpD-associated family protein [Lactococcus]AWN66997.1 DUF1905 domain-containing protein [Lactococcus lactis subsp. lactis]MBK0030314.1 YdeI/OmpD-associated family protein [Lactococcus sp. S47]MDR1822913.1 YdeI/OmpD-associated family protein [Lactococcus lactis]QNL92643.1 YdeI/OmpD-associated family protein [Lactococcus lactis]
MKSYSFQAELEIIGINPFVAVPPDILQKIFQDSGREKSPIPICGQINEKTYQQNLMFFKGDWRLYVNTTMLKNSPKRIGEIFDFTIYYDSEPRIVKQPQVLSEALAKNPEAKKVFDQLIPSKQVEINRYIARLKTEEAIERNVRRAIGFLLGKNSFVGRDKP